MKNMKKMNKVIAAAIVMAGFATNANAQSVDNAKTTAVLVQPLTIVKTTDMHFGTVAASALAGTIILGYGDDVSATGGASVIDDALATTAVFTVAGAANESFSIALTATTLVLSNGTDNLTVSGITVQEGTTNTLDGTGGKLLYVGATLEVVADAPAGTYENADELEITVNYN